MGTAWHSAASYPWESGRYVGGIEVVKINIALRIYANKWHVYAGLAILNPSARIQINQFATSTTELFKLMIEGKRDELRTRVLNARQAVFYSSETPSNRTPILLSDKILDQFSLGPQPNSSTAGSTPRNSHLSLLAMVDCWHILGIRPFQHLDLAATPVFRMWIGVAEYLFRDLGRLEDALDSALVDVEHRSDDTEFVIAARGWSQCVEFGNWESYRRRFERTRGLFLCLLLVCYLFWTRALIGLRVYRIFCASVRRSDQDRRRDDQNDLVFLCLIHLFSLLMVFFLLAIKKKNPRRTKNTYHSFI